MHPSLWSWPQWTYLSYVILGLVIYAGMDGKPMKDSTWKFAPRLVMSIAILTLLYCGGFFQ